MENKFQITLTLNSGEGKISGEAFFLPVPRIYPPLCSIRFNNGYKIEGDSWENGNGKLELNGKTYELPISRVSTNKTDDYYDIYMTLDNIPKGGLPFI